MYIDNLVEVHSHILPAVDDGSKSVEMSLQMIDALQKQGAKAIILTPHYYSDEISLDDFLRKREQAFNALEKALPPGSPRLIPAAEVYISKYIFNYDSLDELCIGNSGYALIEHPFTSPFDESDYDRLVNMYCDYGIKPVLAHIERYRALLEDTFRLDQYIKMGCLVQVNINSFYDAPKSIRKKLFGLLENGRIHFVGSDCHNLTSRPPDFSKGLSAIANTCTIEAVEALMHNANELIK